METTTEGAAISRDHAESRNTTKEKGSREQTAVHDQQHQHIQNIGKSLGEERDWEESGWKTRHSEFGSMGRGRHSITWTERLYGHSADQRPVKDK